MELKSFNNYLTEKLGYRPVIGKNEKLAQAADIISKYINKKTGKDYKMFPFYSIYKSGKDQRLGIQLFSNKDNSSIIIMSSNGFTPGIIGEMHYLSDFMNKKADFTMSSDNFPVMSLVSEFAKLIKEPKYQKEVMTLTESAVFEGRSSEPLSDKEKNMIIKQLQGGVPAKKIAENLGLSYGKILKLKRATPVEELNSPVEEENEMTLDDKVQFLEETMQDIYDITRRVAAGAFNSLFITGRAGTGKTYNVEKALKDEGLEQDEDYMIIAGAVSVIMMYKKMFQFKKKTLVFDDCDAVFRDENGRNMLKAALDTKKVRRISYLKKVKGFFDPKEFENDTEGMFNAIESGEVPTYFDFEGRVIFISNLSKQKADPDGAIRSRSILIDVNPDDATLMKRLEVLLPHLEPRDMPIEEKKEIYEFMKKAKDISMRTFVKAAGFKQAGLNNWERMAKRYL